MKLRILRLGRDEDGNVGVGVLPEGEEIFVGGERPDAGGISIRSLRADWFTSRKPRGSDLGDRTCNL
jgi:hypothetical protein